MAFNNIYKGKRILVTGHTGFKGSWLTNWLLELGAEVCGYSIGVPTEPSNFKLSDLEEKILHKIGDVRDLNELEKAFDEFKPEMVFHLAAQPLVRLSYDNPKDTFDTNLGGTVNVLECIRQSSCVEAAVMITSDKCYENLEWLWGYRESDRLGGKDPYSASKACAEIAIHSYIRSFFSDEKCAKVASARAGNVIGGGDWASDRIVPDFVRAYANKNELVLRSPQATRPWQHVLEPLGGYLTLGSFLISDPENIRGEAFNFGPSSMDNHSVRTLIETMSESWPEVKWKALQENSAKKECGLLQLNCDKASALLRWRPALHFTETVRWTAEWYMAHYCENKNMAEVTSGQINSYTELARNRGISWAE